MSPKTCTAADAVISTSVHRQDIAHANPLLSKKKIPNTQEEYCNEATLEARLQAVARIMVARPKSGGPVHGAPSANANANANGLSVSGGGAPVASRNVNNDVSLNRDANGQGHAGRGNYTGPQYPGSNQPPGGGQRQSGAHNTGSGGHEGHALDVKSDPIGMGLSGGSGRGGGGTMMMSNGAPVIRGAAAAQQSGGYMGSQQVTMKAGGGNSQSQQQQQHMMMQQQQQQQQQQRQMQQSMQQSLNDAQDAARGKGKKMTAVQLKAAQAQQQKQQMALLKQQQQMQQQQRGAGGASGSGMDPQKQPQLKMPPGYANMTPAQQQQVQQKMLQQRAAAMAQHQRQGGGGAPMGHPGGAAQGGMPGQGQGHEQSTPNGMTEEHIKKAYIVKQQRWLLFLRHASKCQAAEGACQYTPHCHVAKSLWEHVLKCVNPTCQYPRCLASRELLKHHQNCKDARCPVCGPVRSAMLKQRSQVLMQQQQMGGGTGQGPAKKQRTDGPGPGGTAHPGAPVPSAIRGSVGQKRPGGEGTSLLECFSPDEVRTHLATLRLTENNPLTKGQPMSARRRDAEAERAIAGATEQACRACGVERLTFEPPPLYCYSCVGRIKRGQVYYHIPAHVTGGEARKDAWCNTCYNAINGHIEVEGTKYGKNQLAKKKNDDDLEEPWVQCDYCNDWYHQICVLFNGRRNEGGEGTCVRLSQIRRHAVLSLTLVTVVHTSPNTRP